MRTLTHASASVRPAERQLKLRSLVLFPAVVVTAAVIHAPGAAAFSGDLRWPGSLTGPEAVRYVVRGDVDVRPSSIGRKHVSVRRRGHRQGRVVRKSRQRVATIRAAREGPREVQASAGPAILQPSPDMVPLGQRSLVAMHPLLPDAINGTPHRAVVGDLVPDAEGFAPRCKGVHPNAFALAMASFGRDFQASEPAMVEGEWPHCRGAMQPQSTWRLAGLGSALHRPGAPTSPTEPGWPIHWRASASCLAAPLRAALDRVASEFGPLTVNSTCRSREHNARVGGAPRSYHLSGNAVDFRVRSHFDEVLRFLARMRSVGGLTHYGSGVFHIDTGPRRSWGPNSWGRGRVRTGRRRA